MFVYEKDGKLNIAFDSNKPVTTPDVILWKDETAGKIYVKIGDNTLSGDIPA